MLMLTLIVGIGVFIPIPDKGYYFFCASVELLVASCADLLNSSASSLIVWLSFTMVAIHFAAFFLIGSRVDCPYHNFIVICEYAEIIICIILSKPILGDFHARSPRIF